MDKSRSEFYKNKNRNDGLNSYCKPCHKTGNNDYYARSEYRRSQIRDRDNAQIDKLRDYVWNYLENHACVDCGESDPIVLEFDHVRGVKVRAVADMVRGKVSLKSLEAEIAKCEVRCANCHRRITAKRGGWWRKQANQCAVEQSGSSRVS